VRTVRGEVVFPHTAQPMLARRLVIEISDVSLADTSSVLLAAAEIPELAIEPGLRVPFTLAEVPEGAPSAMLAARAHADVEGSGGFSAGDLLTTVHVPVPVSGNVDRLEVPVTPI